MKQEVLAEDDAGSSCLLVAEGEVDQLAEALAPGLGGDLESLQFVLGIPCINKGLPSKNSSSLITINQMP